VSELFHGRFYKRRNLFERFPIVGLEKLCVTETVYCRSGLAVLMPSINPRKNLFTLLQ